MAKKVFIGGPFKAWIDPTTSKLEEKYQRRLKELIFFFENRHYEVHNAHQREDWGANFWEPDQCTKLDYNEIASCDIFIAFPGVPASPGTHIELGWASALGKKIVLLMKKGEYYAHLVKGLYTVSDVEYLYYNDPSDYISALEKVFPIQDLQLV